MRVAKDKPTDDAIIPVEGFTYPKNIPVKSAFLHQAITWPGVAGSEKTLHDGKIKGIVMYLIPQGLLLEAKGKMCIVPHTNVVNYVL